VKWVPTAIVDYIDGVEWFRDSSLSQQPPGSTHFTIQLDWSSDGTTTTPS
jgi:hypothetical protein